MNGYEWLWRVKLWWMVMMNGYESFLFIFEWLLWMFMIQLWWMVMNGREWLRIAIWMVVNGYEWFWYYDMNDCELCTSTYFHIFPHISTISIWYSSRLSWPPPPLFPEVQSDKLEGSVGLCWMGHLSAVAAGCLGQTKSRMIHHWGFSERGFKLKPHVSWLVIWNIFYFSINWE